MKTNVNAIFKRADGDLRTAEYLLASSDEEFRRQACFHLQQATEKFLKALLAHFEISYRLTHDLELLVSDIQKVDPTFPAIDFSRMDDYGVQIRYSDHPIATPTEPEAQEALTKTRFVQNEVKKRVSA